MIDVHSLESSRAHRILWVLEELGLPYNVIHYKREPVTNFAPESLRAIHPLRKSPVIVDNGKILAESGAIVEYLVDRYGKGSLRPTTDSADFADYLYWLHFAEGTFAPANLMVTTLTPLGEPAKSALDRYKRLFEEALNLVESTLAGRRYLLGNEFTAADVQTGYSIDGAVRRGTADSRFPRLIAYAELLRARPAYQRAREKA